MERCPDSKETNKLLKDIHDGNTASIQEVFQKYPDLHWTSINYNKTGDTVLHIAARLGHVNIIKDILEKFRPNGIDCKNKDDKTALHEAAQFAQFEACKTLLLYGANVNAIKRADWTPLMLSCTKINGDKNYKIVELFLNHKASINFRNKDGWTSLHLICREGDINILELLLRQGVDPKIRTKNGRTALHIAALHGHQNIVEKLIKYNLDINGRDSCGNTPLHEAVLSGNIEICTSLLNCGADPWIKNNSDYTLLHLAASQGHLNIIYYFLDLNFDVNNRTPSGITPLHCAARNNHRHVYNFLVSQRADEHSLDDFKRKASDYFISSESGE